MKGKSMKPESYLTRQVKKIISLLIIASFLVGGANALVLSVILVNINLFSLPVLGTAYNVVHAQISGESNVSSCQNLWWYDSSHQYCQQQQFCGAYMYASLYTFQTKTECETDLNSIRCIKEGETIPVVANPPECCSGLKLIKPKLENQIGIYGYCTAKCGNGICESETESSYNCSEDCKDIVTCNSCFDCTLKINRANPGAVVKLANDIEGDNVYIDQWGNELYRCISWTGSNSNVTLDGDGHKIKGTRKNSDGRDSVGQGIYIESNYNTIKNCKILDYYEGIYMIANNNLIEDNEFTYSDFETGWNGFVRGILYGGDNNVISGNTFVSIPMGIHGSGMNNVIENNNFTRVTHGISLIEYGNGHNNTIKSNILSRCYEGIYLQDTQDNTIVDNDISLGGGGIKLIGYYSENGASSNKINNNIIKNNDAGIYIGNVAKNNILDSNTVCYSKTYEDIKNMKIENNNLGYNNTCDKVSNWNDEGAVDGCVFKCPILQSIELPSYSGSREFVLEGLLLIPSPSPTPISVSTSVVNPVIIPTLPINPTQADYQNLLNALLKQLAYLQEQSTTQRGVSGYQFTHNFQLGNSGEDVTQLQTFLKAQGTEIYPEGLVTGYFGSLTQKAVQRFQERYNIARPGDLGYGYVGPKTRGKINSL